MANIDTEATGDQLKAILGRIKDAWTHLGLRKPHFSVLTDRQFLPENLQGSIGQFWRSGENEAAEIERLLARHALTALAGRTCVEYGCGVGRVSMGLATRFARVHAYDISFAHLARARERAREVGAANVHFHLVPESVLEKLQPCDFYYSRIVFQHNPPPVIGELIRKALAALSPGGIAVFQVPVEGAGYAFSLEDWLLRDHELDMQMHCFPEARILEIVAQHGCTPLEVKEDNSTGVPEQFVSKTFVIRKS